MASTAKSCLTAAPPAPHTTGRLPPPQSCPTPLTLTTSEDTPALIGRLLRDIVSMRSIMLKTEAVTPRP